MLGPVDYTIWLAVILAEVLSLLLMLWKKAFTQHLALVLYVCACLAVDVGRYSLITTSGYASGPYYYFYFYSGSVLTIGLYLVLMSLYAHVFSDMGVSRQIRAAAIVLLAGTAAISYYMVASSSPRFITRFVVELGQNLYFVGVLLAYLLWGAMAKLRENRARLVQLVLSMGIYVSLSAGGYALDNLYPKHEFWRYYFPIIGLWLPVSWAYTFVKAPEDARMPTSQVIAPSH